MKPNDTTTNNLFTASNIIDSANDKEQSFNLPNMHKDTGDLREYWYVNSFDQGDEGNCYILSSN